MAATRGVKHTKRPYAVIAVLAFCVAGILLRRILVPASPDSGVRKVHVTVVEAFPAGEGIRPSPGMEAPLVCMQGGNGSSAVRMPASCPHAVLVACRTGAGWDVHWVYSGWTRRVRTDLRLAGGGRATLWLQGLPRAATGLRLTCDGRAFSSVVAQGASWGDRLWRSPARSGTAGPYEWVIRVHNLGRIPAVAKSPADCDWED